MTQTSLSITAETLNNLAAFSIKASTTELKFDPGEYSFRDVVKDVTTEAEQHDLTYIDHGSNRIVFDAPNSPYVVKLSLETEFRSGIEQNRVETHIWETINDAYAPMNPIKNRFFQVIESDADNRWVVMERAVLTKGDAEFDAEEALTAILDTFSFLPYDCEFCVEDNIGWNDETGRYAIYDYGSHIPRTFVERILGHEHVEIIGEDNVA